MGMHFRAMFGTPHSLGCGRDGFGWKSHYFFFFGGKRTWGGTLNVWGVLCGLGCEGNSLHGGVPSGMWFIPCSLEVPEGALLVWSQWESWQKDYSVDFSSWCLPLWWWALLPGSSSPICWTKKCWESSRVLSTHRFSILLVIWTATEI